MFGGKNKGDEPPTTGEAIQKLSETEEMLMKKQDFLEKKIEQELSTAKKNGTNNKRGMYVCMYVLYTFV
jgi:charged multivesicular body protein 4